jgi:hypothetical protein
VKGKGERKLDFNGFLDALQLIADKKGSTLDAVIDQIVEAGGPRCACVYVCACVCVSVCG